MSEQRHRSSVSGEYVTEDEARANPDTTVAEKIRGPLPLLTHEEENALVDFVNGLIRARG